MGFYPCFSIDIGPCVLILISKRMLIHYVLTNEEDFIRYIDARIAGFLHMVDTPQLLGFRDEGYGDRQLPFPPLSQFRPY